ncbi:hypothetical protein CspeluHIS016_0112580 [Cutaneotrichosporon spelunceum]|uniref:N-acetyltransferase domain-containing protein n=1 Tax=Cutaneotrichosporon spelunceum TaxID=1672016 RepID=A0AAD3TQM1_9TREE|nr:hypothetical protein CspeluHIS016_0112580 [Cutaneotrichosporon spelunceum]
MPSTITVRPATPSDAAAIANVHHTAWQEAYSHLPALLAIRTLPQRRAQWAHSLTSGFPWDGTRCLVSESPGVTGFLVYGPNPNGGMEMYSLYVLASHYGTGAAQALMHAGVGDGPCSVWLLADNARAKRFYEKMGFEEDGGCGRREREGLVEMQMVRR